MRPRTRAGRAAALFVASLLVYLANGRGIGAQDTVGSRYLPFAVLLGGCVCFDPLVPARIPEPRGRPTEYWARRAPDGRLLPAYPPALPLLLLPLYAPAAAWVAGEDIEGRRFRALAEHMEKGAAAAVAAASVAAVFLVLAAVASPATALLLAAGYAFGTSTWATSSQALWQHGMVELLLALLLLALLREGRGATAAAGVLSGLLVAVRPTSVFFAAAALALVAVRDPRRLPLFVAAGAAALLPFATLQASLQGSPLGGQAAFASPFRFAPAAVAEGLGGLLASPKKGLLVFSPFLLFAAFSLRGPAEPPLRRLLAAFVPAALALLGTYAAYSTWWGGASYGPRYLTDLLPVAVLALVPAVERLRTGPRGLRAAFALALAWSVTAQAAGAFVYPRGGSVRMHLWDWSEPAPLRELRAALRTPARGGPGARPLPPAAFRAEWLGHGLPARMAPGERRLAVVRVRNAGTVRWPSRADAGGTRGAVRLGVWWRAPDGSRRGRDGGRADLLAGVEPGAVAAVLVPLRAPREAGAWRVEIELLQEGMVRFRAPGSPPLAATIEVEPTGGGQPARARSASPAPGGA